MPVVELYKKNIHSVGFATSRMYYVVCLLCTTVGKRLTCF